MEVGRWKVEGGRGGKREKGEFLFRSGISFWALWFFFFFFFLLFFDLFIYFCPWHNEG